MGIFKTRERILEKYFWPAMTRDLKDHIRTCEECQRSKPLGRPAKVPLILLPQPTNPNHRIHVDLLGPLATGGSGKKYVMVIKDSFTKYVELVALLNKEAGMVAMAIVDTWVTRYSMPAEILTDGGKEFANKLLDSICLELRVLYKQTSPFHPQCNAQVEVFNLTMRQYLQTRSVAHNWTGKFAPRPPHLLQFFHFQGDKEDAVLLLFGMLPRMPILELEEMVSLDESQPDLMKILRQMGKEARRSNLDYKSEYERKYKETYGTRTGSIKEDDEIWVENVHKVGANPKLQRSFLGPYRAVRVKESNMWYQDKGKVKVAHLHGVKIARRRGDTAQPSPQETKESAPGPESLQVVMSGEERDHENGESTLGYEDEVPLLLDTHFPPTPAPLARALQRPSPEDIHMRTLLEPIVDIGEEEGPQDVHMRTMVEGSATGGHNKRKPEEPAGVVDGAPPALRSHMRFIVTALLSALAGGVASVLWGHHVDTEKPKMRRNKDD